MCSRLSAGANQGNNEAAMRYCSTSTQMTRLGSSTSLQPIIARSATCFSPLRLLSSGRVGEVGEEVTTLDPDYHMIPKHLTVGKKIAVRTYLDRNRTELSDRTYMPQKAWFSPYTPQPQQRPFDRTYQQVRYDYEHLETNLIWKAFDTPELISMFLRDECLRGNTQVYADEFLEKALYYTNECRYWRSIGITKPFYNKYTLRAHCWEDRGLQVGTVVFSEAMRHALMDLERAKRRQDLGLSPQYVWDKWGPIGFVDGSRNDYLPRFRHNPYRDPDGVEVSVEDILPFNTHDVIKDRYQQLIFPDTSSLEGVFEAPSHGTLGLLDVPHPAVIKLYQQLNPSAGGDGVDASISPSDLRLLFFLSADAELLTLASQQSSWDDVHSSLQPVLQEHNEKVEAARLFTNTAQSADQVRAFYEEKCGFHDFMYTSDKEITGAVLNLLTFMKRVCGETAWGRPLAQARTNWERQKVMGPLAFGVYRQVESAVLEKKRKAWADRFSGEAKEETTLDYLLENFGRRVTSTGTVGSTGEEYDREQEPIGRQVQRRVLDSDKAEKLSAVRRSRGRMWSKKKSVFDSLHQKQLQNVTYGVR